MLRLRKGSPLATALVAAALGVVFLAAEGLVIALGADLHAAVATAWEGTWGTGYSAAQVLFRTSTLLLVAAASDIALRAGFVSVGVEGQVTVACFASALVGARWPQFGVLGAVTAGCAASAALGACIAWLYLRRGVHVVLSGLLLNPLAALCVSYALAHGGGLDGTVRTAAVPSTLRLHHVDAWWPQARGSALSTAVFALPPLLLAIYVYFTYTSSGREVRLCGLNARACRAQGVEVHKRLVQALLLSACVASLSALPLVFGGKGYFEEGMGAGAGFSGLAVAMMARGRVLRLALFALGVATVEQASLACHAYVPRDAASMLLAIFLVATCVADGARGVSASRSVA